MKNRSTGTRIKSNQTMFTLLRNAGAMHHRLDPRGGAENEERDLLAEYLLEEAEGDNDTSCGED